MMQPRPGQLWKWTNPLRRSDMYVVLLLWKMDERLNSDDWMTYLLLDIDMSEHRAVGDMEPWNLSVKGWELISDATSD